MHGGAAQIGRGVLLGAHATVLGNISIGDGALIASVRAHTRVYAYTQPIHTQITII